MTAPDLVQPSDPARRSSGLAIGFGVASLAVTLISALIVWGWTAFSSIEGNSAAGWLLLLLVPLVWLGAGIGVILGVVALAVAIAKRASVAVGIIAVVVAVFVIVLGIAFGYGPFIAPWLG
jgi:hypothetical protein